MLGRLAQSRWADERAAATGMTPRGGRARGRGVRGRRRRPPRARAGPDQRRAQARGRARRARRRRAARPALRDRARARADARQARRRRRAARRVPPPRLAVGLRRARRARRAAEDVHVIGLTATPPVGLPDRRGRALRGAARPGRLHRPDARRGPRRPPRALPGARVADRAAERRARLAGRARHPLPRADHEPARRRRSSRSGSSRACASAAAPPTTTPRCRGRRSRSATPGSPAPACASCSPAGCEVPHGRAARRGVPPAAGPRRLARAARGLRAALPRAAGLARGVRRATTRSPPRCASSASSSPARACRRGTVGGRPAADRLAGQVARARRGALRRARRARRGAARRSCCATPSWPPSAPTTRSPACSTPRPAPPATRCSRSPPTTARRSMRPLLVSGRGLRCVPADADVLLEALRAAAEERFALPEWEAEPDGLLISLRSSGAEWMPRAWVELATRLLIEGTTTVLVGTRALLGEGWNCPPLNVLVDMTVATTGVSVQQMRGRSLRLDPADPEKVASNWDVVCVAPDLVRGSADYERFVRKHLHLFAPAEDGEVEAGPSHVHPELGPFAPPPVERFGALNAELARARRRPRRGARALADRHALPRRRAAHPAGAPDARAERARRAARRERRGRRSSPSASRSPAGSAAPRRSASLGVAAERARAARRARARARGAGVGRRAPRVAPSAGMPLVLPLDAAARAVAEAYRELGELSPRPPPRCAIEPRAAGYLRCELRGGDARRGRALRRRARRARERLGRAALRRLAPARRSAARRARPCSGACSRAGRRSTSACTRCPPTSRATRSAPRPSPAPGAGTSGRAGSCSRSAREEGREARAEAASAGRRLRDAGQRRLGLSERVLGRVLAVLGGAVGGVGVARPGAARQARSAAAASSAASRQASSTGLHSGSRRSTISSVSGTSSRRDSQVAVLIARAKGIPDRRW